MEIWLLRVDGGHRLQTSSLQSLLRWKTNTDLIYLHSSMLCLLALCFIFIFVFIVFSAKFLRKLRCMIAAVLGLPLRKAYLIRKIGFQVFVDIIRNVWITLGSNLVLSFIVKKTPCISHRLCIGGTPVWDLHFKYPKFSFRNMNWFNDNVYDFFVILDFNVKKTFY